MKKRTTLIVLRLICLCILIFLFEFILRSQHKKFYNNMRNKYHGREICTQSHPTLIYAGVPNKCGQNSLGYNDAERSYDKPEDVIRIILIGDSVSAGQGAGLNESFARVLEAKLNNFIGHEKIEVIIMARSGYSTSQELFVLENQALKYNPDLILWSYVLNDPAHPIFHNADGEFGRYFYKPKIYLWHFFKKTFFFIKENIKSTLKHCSREYHKLLHCVYWNDVVSNMEKIAEITQAENIPVVFIIHPVFEWNKTYAQYSLTGVHDRLKNLAKPLGFFVIDILDIYKNYDPNDIRLHKNGRFDPWHPNAKGYDIVAEYIYKNILYTFPTKEGDDNDQRP